MGCPFDKIKQISFLSPLMMTAHRIEMMGQKYIFSKFDISQSAFRILKILSEIGEMGTQALGNILGYTPSNVSQQLKSLEKRGFVKRSYGLGGDKRSVMVQVTKKGEGYYQGIKKIMLEHIEVFKQKLSKKERDQYVVLFEKLNRVIDQIEIEYEENLTNKK